MIIKKKTVQEYTKNSEDKFVKKTNILFQNSFSQCVDLLLLL